MDNEQNEKMGKFISDLRKSKGMTQKVLAEQLKVTDKAVSKWERGISCPDISLLIPLGKILGVSTSELLNGERESIEEGQTLLNKTEERKVENALLYSDRSTVQKVKKIKLLIQILLIFSYVAAAFVCVICDYFTAGRLTWSLIVLLSLAASWIVILPLFGEKGKMIYRCLMALSLTVIPYLFVLSRILGEPVVFYMGTCIAAVSAAGAWCVYGIFRNHWDRKFRAGAYSALIALLLTWAVNRIVYWFYPNSGGRGIDNLINILSLAGLTVILLAVDFYMNRKSK